jgi:MFS family permease
MLVSSRFLQGIGEALAAPAALGLLVVLFPDPGERVKAVGIWGGLAGLGGTTGAVTSGVLTDVPSWRWIFYINVPVALLALLLVPRLVSESRMVREQDQRMDLPGRSRRPVGWWQSLTGHFKPPRTRGAPRTCSCRFSAESCCSPRRP